MLDSLDTLIAFTLIMLVVSLLITVAVQMITSALNLRGLNLARGLRETFKVVSPALADQAKDLANHVLSGPIISDSTFHLKPFGWQFAQLASAARPAEVFDAIHRLAIGRHAPGKLPAEQLADFSTQAGQLLQALGMPPAQLQKASDVAEATKTTIQDLESTALAAIQALPAAEQEKVQRALKIYSAQLTNYATHITNQAVEDVEDASAAINDAYDKFEYWYNIAQERAQAWFTMHARMFTVLFAFAFALALQLDTLDIYHIVSSNKTLKEKLVAQSEAVTKQATDILSDSTSAAAEALTNLADQQRDAGVKAKLQELAKTLPANATRGSVREKVEAIAKAPPAETTGAAKTGDATKTASADSAAQTPPLVYQFDTALDTSAIERLKSGAASFEKLGNSLNETGFELMPSGHWRWKEGWFDGTCHHWLGILFSAALLSLGAPFWFNTLKSLTNLRSAVASNISDEVNQNTNPGAGPKKTKAPPTV